MVDMFRILDTLLCSEATAPQGPTLD